jgi:hypothetical protein
MSEALARVAALMAKAERRVFMVLSMFFLNRSS